jgi:hypothetical protein
MDECERLSAALRSLEGKFRRRAERARDEGDLATMVRMRDAARAANQRKAEIAAMADDLALDLARAQAEPSQATMDALMTRLDATATKSQEILAVYKPFVEWDAEPS